MTPYQKIVRAAKRETGCRLTADECRQMGMMDDAIFTRAELDDMADKGEAPDDYKPSSLNGSGSDGL